MVSTSRFAGRRAASSPVNGYPSPIRGNPLREKMQTNAVIVGGGIAGLTCAWELARQGLEAVLVEAASLPGGHVGTLSCKATDRCQRCGACVLEDILNKVATSDRITTLLRTSVSKADRHQNGFRLSLTQRPFRVLPDKCTGCGSCRTVCPAPGALTWSVSGRRVDLAEEECLFFQNGSCGACQEACPEGAVNLKDSSVVTHLDASAVIVAAGFQPFDPRGKPHLGYGRVAGVVTAAELDALLRADRPIPTATELPLRSIAFIQCVGSRDTGIGRNYCSQVCCGYALRMARLLGSRFPHIEPSMFYMDIQTFERDFETRLAESARHVRLVRAMPAEIRTGADGRPEVIYQGPDDTRMIEAYDLVVLSVGISPGKGLRALSELFGADINQDGFLGGNGEGIAAGKPGIFVAGTAQGPRSIADTVSHAVRAAAEAATHLRSVVRREKP
jgi:heterodisulfide reductase subunit A2